MHTEISPLMRSALDATTRRLAGQFRGVFSEETVARCVEVVRRIRDDVGARVSGLLETLTYASADN